MMKKVLLSIVLAAMTLSANAADDQREYESLLSESKVWTMSYQGVVNPEVYGDIYHFTDTKLVGDTVINDIHFMRKYQRQWSLGEETPADWTATNEYLGQDGGKIYRYSDRTQNVVLDMDVSLNVGDRIGFVDELGYELPSFFVATAVSDTILTGADDNKPRRCVEVQLEAPQVADMWIEGIGSVTLGITGMEWFLASGAIPKLYKCTDGDAVIYQSTLSPGFYHPLVVRGGKKWTYRHNTFENVYDYYYILEGDTVIAGKNCLKMYSENKGNQGEIRYEGALYEEDMKVYLFYEEIDVPEVMYDFNCQVGDTLHFQGPSLVMQAIESVEILGMSRKRYDFQAQIETDESNEIFVLGNESWLEGIGSMKDFFNMLPLYGNYNSLVACEVNGVTIYQSPTAIQGVRPYKPKADGAIYDLQGRRLSSPPRKGIYIQNGKKMIAR